MTAADPVAGLETTLDYASFAESSGQRVVHIPVDRVADAAAAARAAGFEMCVDVTAVDYLARSPRFDLIVNLLSQQHRARLRLVAGVPGEEPTAPSITGVYPGANFYEREVFDLFGIVFTGHPDLTRIMLPDDWKGHPLRKDYAVGSVPVQFKSAEGAPDG